MAPKRARSPSPPPSPPPSSSPNIKAASPDVHRSNPIEDRASTFIGVYSPCMSSKDLQALPEFTDASHRVAAWRAMSKQRTLSAQPMYDSGHDDDGEQWAGKKLENLLWNMDIAGSVVVARWYGGVLLGPIRFTHIEEAAKEAIKNWRTSVTEQKKKRRLEEEEQAAKVRLVHLLQQRDESIAVLRQLLAEKQASASVSEGAKGEVRSPSKQIDYTKMTLQVLKRLEMARDGTIAWILKQIDKAEEEAPVTVAQGNDDNQATSPIASPIASGRNDSEHPDP